MGALRIARRIYGEESIQVANVAIRVGQLYFLLDGSSSFEGKKYLRLVISIREKKLGPTHKQVEECKKLLEEMEAPPVPVAAPVAKVAPKPVLTKQHRINQEELEKDMQQWNIVAPTSLDDFAQLQSYNAYSEPIPSYFGEVEMDLAPPPPPPAPPMAPVGPPPPPPPPGAKVVSANAYLQEINNISNIRLKKAEVKVVQKNKVAKEGWWKQNYQSKPKHK